MAAALRARDVFRDVGTQIANDRLTPHEASMWTFPNEVAPRVVDLEEHMLRSIATTERCSEWRKLV